MGPQRAGHRRHPAGQQIHFGVLLKMRDQAGAVATLANLSGDERIQRHLPRVQRLSNRSDWFRITDRYGEASGAVLFSARAAACDTVAIPIHQK